jgi:hypothetical protein
LDLLSPKKPVLEVVDFSRVGEGRGGGAINELDLLRRCSFMNVGERAGVLDREEVGGGRGDVDLD